MSGSAGRWHRRRWLGAVVGLMMAGSAAIAWRDTTAPPVLRTMTVGLPGLTARTGPVRVVWVADLHVSGPLMPPAKIAGLVARINALHPDIVLLGGDYLGAVWPSTHRYTMREALAPFALLRARFGVAAILGNHEHDGEPPVSVMPASLAAPMVPAQREFARIGIPVLLNSAVRLGPITVGGRDIERAGRWGSWQLDAAMKRLGPPYLGVTHGPEGAATMPSPVTLVLAGHTHCGQVRVPGVSWLIAAMVPRFGACGLSRDDGRILIVTAGIGESRLPLRFRAPADFWQVTLVPER